MQPNPNRLTATIVGKTRIQHNNFNCGFVKRVEQNIKVQHIISEHAQKPKF